MTEHNQEYHSHYSSFNSPPAPPMEDWQVAAHPCGEGKECITVYTSISRYSPLTYHSGLLKGLRNWILNKLVVWERVPETTPEEENEN
jgi:hypothetical protein